MRLDMSVTALTSHPPIGPYTASVAAWSAQYMASLALRSLLLWLLLDDNGHGATMLVEPVKKNAPCQPLLLLASVGLPLRKEKLTCSGGDKNTKEIASFRWVSVSA